MCFDVCEGDDAARLDGVVLESFESMPMPVVDFDPITPTPIMLMQVGPEMLQPVCRALGCPHVDACINEGFCDDDYMLYHQRPHIWLGDYA